MDVNHLRSFLALAETGNLTRAAERLNYAPSSVSAHLRAIETELPWKAEQARHARE